MLTRLEIEKLYNRFDYQIDFDAKTPLKIITGPNGFGKTTILNIINNAMHSNFWYFYFLPFKSIKLYLKEADVEVRLDMSHDMYDANSENMTVANRVLQVETYRNDEPLERPFEISSITFRNACKQIFNGSVPTPVDGSYPNEIISEFLERIAFTDDNVRYACMNWRMFCEDKYCNLVKDQRLISFHSNAEQSKKNYTVDNIASDFHDRFTAAQYLFIKESQRLDASFVTRLIAIDKSQVDAERVKKDWDALQKRIERLNQYQLVPEYKALDSIDTTEYNEVLSLYLADMNEKLNQLEPFYEKLSQLDQFLKKEYFSYKTIQFARGFLIAKSDEGEPIALEKLSSGEQNLIILSYELVFNTSQNTLLLVDEPENSLHMAWIEYLLAFYKEVAEKNHCQMIIATHSPAFINGRWELTYDLFKNNLAKKQ